MAPILELPPFSIHQQLCTELSTEGGAPTNTSVPGHPCLKLGHLPQIREFLKQEFWAQDLETFAPHLWVMSTYSSSNINPLHRQRVKGREIIVTEESRLHLVWFHDRIFIKPLPKYILSWTFWEMFLVDSSVSLGEHRNTIRSAALGYLRSYRYLIKHESDFIIAKQDHLRLIPQDVQWADFCHFVSALDGIKDVDVSGRYSYGELRLSRLNFYAPIFLRKFHFEQVHGQYSDYFTRLYGPVLFVLAGVSTLLNGMQVQLAVDQVASSHHYSMWSVFRVCSAITLIGTTFISICFCILWLWIFLDEWIYTIKVRRSKRREFGGLPC